MKELFLCSSCRTLGPETAIIEADTEQLSKHNHTQTRICADNMVIQKTGLSHHSMKVDGLNSSVWSLHVFPMSTRVFSGYSSFPHSLKICRKLDWRILKPHSVRLNSLCVCVLDDGLMTCPGVYFLPSLYSVCELEICRPP